MFIECVMAEGENNSTVRGAELQRHKLHRGTLGTLTGEYRKHFLSPDSLVVSMPWSSAWSERP